MTVLCRYCARAVVCRPRGLCHRCYDDPVIRELYPPQSTNKPRRSCRDRRLARCPTRARPGTPAKLLVFQQRLAQRVRLFHPHDAKE